ncbi:accessory Sec system translocase SecA2 [Metabacillus fastidiosus]|uniref:accessory Sec system translocase SecA2 n=1 Tax=Metabacillus fastidiosus TaxID=1458 RepID=UPI002E1DB5EF|nr:accessory Sec system translocase SecA2 [Metabacillus fastidiosus]MED4534120.1 accessory Sec system translocase SecA2 [Metabacillus fastidiosus]
MSIMLNQYTKLKSKSEINKLQKLVKQINQLEDQFKTLTNEQLREKTIEFQNALKDGKTLKQIRVEAFAVVKEAASRVINQRHYDVQILGGLVLTDGNIGQMQTGEGKTLMASLPSYLFALEGKGVHVITSNEYLAQRDYELIGEIHKFLGLKVGLNIADLSPAEKKEAYNSHITYGTGTEFGFDYLRDHMVFSEEEKVQRGQHFAIIDEIDNTLIDEARTPLIIASKSMLSSDLFAITSMLVKSLKKEEDYEINLVYQQVHLTEKGILKFEKAFGIDNLYDTEHQILFHSINQSLQAHFIFKKDKDYIIRDGKIELVDSFTGRVMEGRNLSNGLHQAIEAKEGLEINEENLTQASVTIQNYFRMYSTLCGMTGSALPAQKEFMETYGMDVINVPTNRPNQRIDHEDLMYKDLEHKYKKIINTVKEIHETGRPILIGTTSIEQSETLSEILKKNGIKHQLLNAKSVEEEAKMISIAGQRNMITIATNMAGRGTDILLGEGVAELGGLFILGTERHESLRIDMQLRGRAGRQGDPGSSQFILSLEDHLMHQFDEEELEKYKKKIKVNEEGLVISPNPIKFLTMVQETVENGHFSSRIHLLKLDDVVDQQRKLIYSKRNSLLNSEEILNDAEQEIRDYVDKLIVHSLDEHNELAEEKRDAFTYRLQELFGISLDEKELIEMDKESLAKLLKPSLDGYFAFINELDDRSSIEFQIRNIMMRALDQMWISHMNDMENLKEGIHLRGYAQEDPYRLYTLEGFELFDKNLESFQYDMTAKVHSYVNSLKKVEE